MNNCNKCYYNSYLHDRYIINSNRIKIKYKKLKDILKLNVFYNKNEHDILNRLKLLINKIKSFVFYYKSDYCLYYYCYCCLNNCLFDYSDYIYYNKQIINKYSYNYYCYKLNDYHMINLTHNQIIIEITKYIYYNYYYYYNNSKLIIDDYFEKWTYNNIPNSEYYVNIGFYKKSIHVH